MGTLAREPWLGNIGLGTLAWELWLGSFGFETFAWELWLRDLCLGISSSPAESASGGSQRGSAIAFPLCRCEACPAMLGESAGAETSRRRIKTPSKNPSRQTYLNNTKPTRATTEPTRTNQNHQNQHETNTNQQPINSRSTHPNTFIVVSGGIPGAPPKPANTRNPIGKLGISRRGPLRLRRAK